VLTLVGEFLLEGWAPTRPLEEFGTAGAVPSELLPNKFGAQEKFRHQPLAKASGMDVNGAAKTNHATDFSP